MWASLTNRLFTSLNGRLLFTASVVLVCFLGLTGIVLDQAFRDSALTALRERLRAHVFTLMTAAEVDGRGNMYVGKQLAEPRYNTPNSGLYAMISNEFGRTVWRSRSMLGMSLPASRKVLANQRVYRHGVSSTGEPLYIFDWGISWLDDYNNERLFVFTVAEGLDGYNRQIEKFRSSLSRSFAVLTLVLLVVQAVILRWGLRPLRNVAEDLTAIETGQRTQLTGRYPRELHRLTENLNQLIRSERARLERTRRSLGDLAHSLKTPLAVLRGCTDDERLSAATREVLNEQIDRMQQIIDYQLHKAATSGRTALMAPVKVLPEVRRVVASLDKVYAGKQVACSIDVNSEAMFYGDPGDLLELLGNVLDNAYKCCRRNVRVSACADRKRSGEPACLDILVEDDGHGIAPDKVQRVLERGFRTDEQLPGHGLGLAMVREVVAAYDGELTIERSELGGARIAIRFPPPGMTSRGGTGPG